MDINNRKLAILSLVSKGYLKTGEPVGSKSLVSLLGDSVSSATIRNDMADLERLGLVFQPHTSAGRIPTSKGLTLYIDKLMERRRLSKQRRDFIDSIFMGSFSVEGAISAASDALAEYSKCASFSTAPSSKKLALKQIDFIKTGINTMVFVILTETNTTKSVFVKLDGEISENALSSLSSLAKKRLVSMPLCDITPAFVQTLAAELSAHSLLFSPFFEALLLTAEKLTNSGVYVKGQNHLLNGAFPTSSAARALSMLSSDGLLEVLEPTYNGVKIIIPEGESTALIYSGYHFTDNLMGTIGVLGSDRLDYSSLIPMIEYFSSSLENMIKKSELNK